MSMHADEELDEVGFARRATHELGGLKSFQRSDEGRCIQRQG